MRGSVGYRVLPGSTPACFDVDQGDRACGSQKWDLSKLVPEITDLSAEESSTYQIQCQDSYGSVQEVWNPLKVHLVATLVSHARALLMPYCG